MLIADKVRDAKSFTLKGVVTSFTCHEHASIEAIVGEEKEGD